MITPQRLSQVSLFEGFSPEQLAPIAELCQEVTGQQGEVLFWEGEKAERLYILLEGEVSLFVQLTSRPERVTVAVVNQPNAMFGWSGVVAPYHYTASALCEADSRLAVLDGQSLIQRLEENPAMGFVVIQRIAAVISDRLRHTRLALLKTL